MSSAAQHGAAGGSPADEDLAELARTRDASPHALAHALRGDLDNIVAKALKKDPSQRYATPAAMADDLRRYFGHQPVAARADSVGYRAAKFLARNRWGLSVAAAIVVSLTAGAGVAVWKSIEAEHRRAQAELNAKQTSASLDLLYLVFSDADAMSAKTMIERLSKIRQVIRQNSDDPRVKLLLLERLGGRYMELGAIDETLGVLAETRELAKTVGDPIQLATIACGFANVYVIPGRYAEAERELADAAPYLARLSADELGARAECWQAEAELALLRGQIGRAVRAATTSVAAFEKFGHTRDTLYVSALNQLALGQAGVGDYRSSYRTALKAREALKQLGLQGTQQDLIVAMQEVDMLARGGKPLDAQRLLDEIRADPHVAVDHQVPQFALEQRQGVIAMVLGRPADAVVALEASISNAQAAGNKLFVDNGGIRIVEALTASRRVDAAQARLAALPGVDEELERGGVKAAKYLAAKAAIASARGDAKGADELADKALRTVSSGGEPTGPLLRDTLLLRARTAMATQDWARALNEAQAAVERSRAEAIDQDSSAAVGHALLVQAQVQAARGERSSAATLARAALPHLEVNLGPGHEATASARLLASAG
jgi:serine/threonine-protein kinase